MRNAIQSVFALRRGARPLTRWVRKSVASILKPWQHRQALRQRHLSELAPVRLETVGGNGPLPTINLDSSAALLDLMELPQSDAGQHIPWF
jgi:hypothetical protein